MDNEKIDNRPMFVSVCDPDKKSKGHQFKYSTTMEKNKLFVKGLAKSVNENDLKQIFGKFGTITAVRMPTLRNGHPKGMAYIGKINNTLGILAAFGNYPHQLCAISRNFCSNIITGG